MASRECDRGTQKSSSWRFKSNGNQDRRRALKMKTIGYWATTAILAFVLLSGGITQLLRRPEALEGMAHLGYPVYFVVILGFWKVLGGIALLVPRFPRLKEWAYAGAFFDLTGAAASYVGIG